MNAFCKLALGIGLMTVTPLLGQETSPKTPPATQPKAKVKAPKSLRDLTPEQRKKVEEISRKYRQTVTPIEQRLNVARRQLEELVTKEELDEAAIRAKARNIGEIEADLAIARAQRLTGLREFLPPDQVRRFDRASGDHIPLTRSFSTPPQSSPRFDSGAPTEPRLIEERPIPEAPVRAPR